MFAEYTFYKDTYKGFKIETENEFNFYASRATDKINAISMGTTSELTTDGVKKACCAIADILYEYDGNSTKNVVSRKSGKESETYKVSSVKSSDNSIYEAMEMYLWDYMNRSVYSD